MSDLMSKILFGTGMTCLGLAIAFKTAALGTVLYHDYNCWKEGKGFWASECSASLRRKLAHPGRGY